jgi:hypothetical protein
MVFAKGIFWLTSLTSIINGFWMLFFPHHWYANLPADVSAYGPFNEHFVRDVGLAFFGSGVALGWAAISPLQRKTWLIAGVSFLLGHAVIHAVSQFTGVGPHHVLQKEIAMIYVPAMLLIIAVSYVSKRETKFHDLK